MTRLLQLVHDEDDKPKPLVSEVSEHKTNFKNATAEAVDPAKDAESHALLAKSLQANGWACE